MRAAFGIAVAAFLLIGVSTVFAQPTLGPGSEAGTVAYGPVAQASPSPAAQPSAPVTTAPAAQPSPAAKPAAPVQAPAPAASPSALPRTGSALPLAETAIPAMLMGL